jgi:hypothetical protein
VQYIAILRLRPDASEEAQAKLRRAEVEMVWKLTVSGELRSIHLFSGDGHGAVLQLETVDRAAADAAMRDLPMVAAGLLEVELLSLAPFTGLEALFAATAEA